MPYRELYSAINLQMLYVRDSYDIPSFFVLSTKNNLFTFKYRQFAMVIVERMENDEDVRKSGILIDVCDVVIPIILVRLLLYYLCGIISAEPSISK